MRKLLSIIIVTFLTSRAYQEAVCIACVADLVGGTLKHGTEDAQEKYDTIAMDGPFTSIKRIDQLIFNERVFIIDTIGDECHIQVPGHYYCSPSDATLHNDFWTMASNLATLEKLENPTSIPDSYGHNSEHIICLQQPFHDTKHYRTYPIGTRFVLDNIQDSDEYYRVLVLSKQLHASHVYIPKSAGTACVQLNTDQYIEHFLKILSWLTQQEQGNVPYVYGGNSYLKPYGKQRTTKPLETGKILVNAQPAYRACHSGFDCASLVFRTAQAAGMPWFLKNSSAMRHHLKELTYNDTLENGDLLYIPGHIMVISSQEPLMIIEARTLLHGYGYVHEIPISSEFQDITTTEQLLDCHFNRRSIVRLNAQGNSLGTTTITLLKTKSIFDQSAPGRI